MKVKNEEKILCSICKKNYVDKEAQVAQQLVYRLRYGQNDTKLFFCESCIERMQKNNVT